MEESNKDGIFSEREIGLTKNCRVYSANDPTDLPGHDLMIIIAKMADMLDIMSQMLDEFDVRLVAGTISRKYDRKSGPDPGKVLFDQLKKMAEMSNFIRRDPITPKQTVENIAKAQGRDVIYICPDETIRSKNGDIIGGKSDHRGGGIISREFRGCLPVTFTNDEVFNEWLSEVTP